MLQFEQPFLLLLLIPIGILIYLTWKQMSLPYPAFQRYLILACRALLFALIILALAGTTWAQPVSRQSTVFVGDISASTGSQRHFIEQWISNAIKHKRPDDQVGTTLPTLSPRPTQTIPIWQRDCAWQPLSCQPIASDTSSC